MEGKESKFKRDDASFSFSLGVREEGKREDSGSGEIDDDEFE